MKKIETLEDQLQEHRNKRGLKFLGSTLKFITSIPDRDEANQIEEKINALIENNEKQKIINSKFEKMLNSIYGQEVKNHFLLEEIHNQLLLLVRTINAAKNDEYLAESLDLNDVKEVTRHELNTIPIINVLEYSNIYIARTHELIVTIYKYPVIEKQCKFFKFTPLSTKHGKISTDESIALCDNIYTRVKNCKNYLSKNICKINNGTDGCIKPLLDNRKAKCAMIQEYNHPLLQIDEGIILLDGINVVDNQTTSGTVLVNYTNEVVINNITYRNFHDKMMEAIHDKHDEDLEIIRILTSTSDLAFDNIDSLKKLLIPIENHPVKHFLYMTLTIVVIIVTIYIILKITKYYVTLREIKSKEDFQFLYNRELERIRQEMNIKQI